MKLVDFLSKESKALSDVGVGRIRKQFIPSVIEYVSKLSGIPKKDLHPLGSTGKKPESGDIDLAVDSGKYDPSEIHERLTARLNDGNYTFINNSQKIYSYVVPVVKRVGDEFVEVGGLVQVDLMFTPRVEWAKFSFFSSDPSSTVYKGAIRTILLRAIAASYEEEGIDMFVYDPATNDLIIRIGRTFDLTKGFRRIFQYRPKRKVEIKGVSPFLKVLQTTHDLEIIKNYLVWLQTHFPNKYDDINIDVKDHEIVIDNPETFLKKIFPGKIVVPKDVETAEQVLDLIKTRFSYDHQIKILNKAKEGLREVATKMRVPNIDNLLIQIAAKSK